MIDEATLEKVKKFPPRYQDEVKDFIEFLEEKKIAKPEITERKPGTGKGTFTFMSPDFDEPMDEFKEYS
jgi:mRNA-degrading endonuclease RelE of RelBE toxin-antitoxin system